jgi:hypothetical protein
MMPLDYKRSKLKEGDTEEISEPFKGDRAGFYNHGTELRNKDRKNPGSLTPEEHRHLAMEGRNAISTRQTDDPREARSLHAYNEMAADSARYHDSEADRKEKAGGRVPNPDKDDVPFEPEEIDAHGEEVNGPKKVTVVDFIKEIK